MRRLAILLAVVASGCPSKSSSTGSRTPTASSAAASSAAPQAAIPSSAAPVYDKLHLTIKSSPEGAAASVDGKPIGKTPMLYDIDFDGKSHEFAFVLEGFQPQTFAFLPVRDGNVVATLKPILRPDAGR